jgi:hypothetical protein
MMNLPPLDPLATAGAPLASTIVVIGVPLVLAVALVSGLLLLILCAAVLRGRTAHRRAPARPRPSVVQVPMSYAPVGEPR